MKVAALNRVDAQAVADRNEDALAAAYLRVLQAAGRKAAQRFRGMAPLAMVAANEPVGGNPPNWTPPDIDELVDLGLIAEQTARQTASLHVKTLAQVLDAYGRVTRQVTVPVTGRPSFDVTNPLALTLLSDIGGRSGDVAKSIRDDLQKIIGDAYTRGLSVLDAAAIIQERTDEFSQAQARMLARTDLNGIANGGSVIAAKAVGVTYKSWLSASDELVRPTHQEANGQTVPIDQPFDVGGESADYPGDPQLSDAEACNCRCTVIYTDSLDGEESETASGLPSATTGATIGGTMKPAQITIPLTFSIGTASTTTVEDAIRARSESRVRGGGLELGEALRDAIVAEVVQPDPPFSLHDFAVTAAADGESAWTATLCVEGVPTVDNGIKRILAVGGGDWLPLPLPLAIMYDSPHAEGSSEAPVCGRIDQIWKAGNRYQAAGIFCRDEVGQKAAAYVGDKLITGVSIDPVDVQFETMLYTNGGLVSVPETEGEAEALAPDLVDMQVITVFASYKIAGATICPVQALTDATISLVAGGDSRISNETEWEVLAPGTQVVASVAPLYPPADWFENPGLDRPTMLTVTDDGRVFGHVAPWKGCHAGYLGRCVPPPRSRTGYSHFHVGRVKTDGGELVAVGRLTLAAGHADTQGLTLEQARAHYDNTATVAAFVRAGEDEHGIWVAGVLRHDVPPAMVQDLLANPLSGDWRNGEMVAAHAVPLPGFPILQASAIGPDGDEQTALIITSTIGLPEPPDLALRSRVLAARARGIDGLAALAHA